MSCEIGYSLYDKEAFAIRKELVYVENLETVFYCGRNELTDRWGYMFGTTNNAHKDIRPTFNKELDGYESEYFVLKYIDFKDFRRELQAMRDEFEEKSRRIQKMTYNTISQYRNRIRELRELQRKCTDEEEYAFNKWEERINELYDEIARLERELDDSECNEYPSYIKFLDTIIKEMEQMVNDEQCHFYVIPYYAY